MSYRVLVAESFRLLRQGICSIVQEHSEFIVVGQAGDGKEAVSAAARLLPDVALIDLSMPGLPGIECIRQIRRRCPGIKIVAMTTYDANEYFAESLQIGIEAFLLKDTSSEELLQALRSVVTGRRFVTPELTASMLEGVIKHQGSARMSHYGWTQLTMRERSIFKLIAEGGTNRTAAEYLNLSPKTVEKHRASLMHKLQLKSAVELTLAAVEMGLVYRHDVAPNLTRSEKNGPPPTSN
jgi:DNA-binding NarL/FixJ family response regulator